MIELVILFVVCYLVKKFMGIIRYARTGKRPARNPYTFTFKPIDLDKLGKGKK